jgi:hypothetical protein
MVSGHTGNVVLRKELRVRAPCPPLFKSMFHIALRRASPKWLATYDRPFSAS